MFIFKRLKSQIIFKYLGAKKRQRKPRMDNPKTQHWTHRTQDEDNLKTRNIGHTGHRTKTI